MARAEVRPGLQVCRSRSGIVVSIAAPVGVRGEAGRMYDARLIARVTWMRNSRKIASVVITGYDLHRGCDNREEQRQAIEFHALLGKASDGPLEKA